MNTLNSKQQYAVKTPHKKVLIMAGAGTGKTSSNPQNSILNSTQH
ncbi:MAG: UvrD-helicase domain-containing protein [Anaeroplasmataceae bacterium]|nr:UvrD-helicase domain-containing protein [Anaeroplasmataceae bacterium]MDE6414245.1 UvrD-helicase domain-containing protein [Anaeroplasmataceae bacterium]